MKNMEGKKARPQQFSLAENINLKWDDDFREIKKKMDSKQRQRKRLEKQAAQPPSANITTAPLFDRWLWQIASLARSEGRAVDDMMKILFRQFSSG